MTAATAQVVDFGKYPNFSDNGRDRPAIPTTGPSWAATLYTRVREEIWRIQAIQQGSPATGLTFCVPTACGDDEPLHPMEIVITPATTYSFESQ